MKIDAVLPLGQLDPGLRAAAPVDMAAFATDARLAEEFGYDGVIATETNYDPFIALAVAAQATTRVGLATAVAIAFPRSPMVTAMTAWSLQALSRGRFTLGLGSQVRGHIERRFGVAWSPPGPWMREYVGALRAIWDCWQNGTRLDVRGPHYTMNLTVPLFTPAPLEHPDIPIHLAALNPVMCRVAGEVADGIRAHPVCPPRYIAEIMLPAARAGAAKTGRDFGRFEICAMPLVATAGDRAALAARVAAVRARLAFYASTPAYLPAFEMLGYGEVAKQLQAFARAQRWDEMSALVDDAMLDAYAVVGTYDEIAGKLRQRYAAVANRLDFAIPAATPAEQALLRDLVTALRQD